MQQIGEALLDAVDAAKQELEKGQSGRDWRKRVETVTWRASDNTWESFAGAQSWGSKGP